MAEDLVDSHIHGERLQGSSPPARTATRVFAVHPLATFWSTVIGKKVVMAVTGAVLVGFVIGHMLGNLKIFSGPQDINAYARFLREVGRPELSYGQVLWAVRVILLGCVILHITAAVQLTRLSWQARPQAYRLKQDLGATFASRTVRWGGVLLVVFVVFHLLHLTLGAVGFQPGQFRDLAVYQNVVAAFALWPVSVFYIVSMAALALHLDHSIWSAFQTLGWSSTYNARSLSCFRG